MGARMGIAYDDQIGDGLVALTVSGLAGRTGHAVAIGKVRESIESGRLKALIIDASAAELPGNPSLSREVWEDFFSELGSRPLAYLPPNGHFAPKRQRMIADLIAEWGGCFSTVDTFDEGRAWCLARLDTQKE